MEAKEHTLTSFDPGKDPFVDPHGNTWVTATFEGITEPVKWVIKDLGKIRVGDSYYGEIKEQTSKAGKPYLRFYRESKPEGGYTQPQQTALPESPSGDYWDDKNAQIRAQWAIGQAVSAICKDGKEPHYPNVESVAKELFAMVDRVKQPQTGLDKARAVAASLKKDDEPAPSDDDAPMYNNIPDDIDLNEIPF